MVYNTEAIVIRSIPYGETHAIVTLLTPAGKVTAMARGAKKPQSRLAAGAQLCAQGVFSLYQGRGMGNIQQVEIRKSRRELHEQLELAAYAAYFCELAYAGAEEAPHGSANDMQNFSALLDRLASRTDPPAILARIWETKVLHMLGAVPQWTRCIDCEAELTDGGSYSAQAGGFVCANCAGRYGTGLVFARAPVIRVLQMFTVAPVPRIGRISLSRETCEVLAKVLRMQMTEYAGLSLKSRDVLASLTMDDFA